MCFYVKIIINFLYKLKVCLICEKRCSSSVEGCEKVKQWKLAVVQKLFDSSDKLFFDIHIRY